MKLNDLKSRPGARQERKRVGRGIGSGLGKTAGRGGKGQTARSGGAKAGFEGGQMPIYRRLPKRGFKNPFRLRYNEINVGRVQAAIDAGRLDPATPVTLETLMAAGIVGRPYAGVRLLGKGDLRTKVSFVVNHASKGAIAAVEKLGGSITIAEPARSARPAAEAK